MLGLLFLIGEVDLGTVMPESAQRSPERNIKNAIKKSIDFISLLLFSFTGQEFIEKLSISS